MANFKQMSTVHTQQMETHLCFLWPKEKESPLGCALSRTQIPAAETLARWKLRHHNGVQWGPSYHGVYSRMQSPPYQPARHSAQ